ncbi:MAG: hypothetical protein JXR63_11375 [Spirochaetales bacterium]|nr:hypothetical protein [Spirochaetales bacterium]
MEKNNWEKSYKDLINFIELHSWCNQSMEKIDEFVAQTKETESYLITGKLKKRLQNKDLSKIENIVSILILYKLDFSLEKISEYTYANLYEKLSIQDLDFLIETMIGFKHPLPPDVSNEIESRSFLSFARAISWAMKLESTVSKVNPQKTALYLILILCLKKINEQNKAIINFLLFRIDVPIPENLYKGILAYIYTLKDIIEQLEHEGEASLAKELFMKNEPDIKKLEEALKLVKKANLTQNSVVIEADKKKQEVKPAQKETKQIESAENQVSITKEKQENQLKPIETAQTNIQPTAPAKPAELKKETNEESQPEKEVDSTDIDIQIPIIDHIPEAVAKEEEKAQEKKKETTQVAQEEEEEEEIWKITFSKNLEKILEILAALDQVDSEDIEDEIEEKLENIEEQDENEAEDEEKELEEETAEPLISQIKEEDDETAKEQTEPQQEQKQLVFHSKKEKKIKHPKKERRNMEFKKIFITGPLVLAIFSGLTIALPLVIKDLKDKKEVATEIAVATEPTTTEPTTTEPTATEPTATEPTATEPTATEPTATEPTATEPTATEPTATKPAATEPAATEPTATEPTATEPTATEPTATEPTATEPTATEPTATKPATTEPAATEPDLLESVKRPSLSLVGYDPILSFSNGEVFWTVMRDDSIWKIFLYIWAGESESARNLQKKVPSNWYGFLIYFLNLNTGIKDPNKIYPDEEYFLIKNFNQLN